MNCFYCNMICYENCLCEDDDEKCNCSVMNNGFCIVCIQKCIWFNYRSLCYILKYIIKRVKKIYKEMKEKYEKVKGFKKI